MSAEDTRERIIAEAEALFARHGFAGTSLRDITGAAGVNLAAVNYHFGGKDGLLAAVLDRIVLPITERRLELLDELEASARHTPDVRDVLACFLRPDVESIDVLRQRDPELPRFVSRMYGEGSDIMGDIIGRQFAENQRRFLGALTAALPRIPPAEIHWRLHLVVGIVVYLFAGVAPPGVPSMVAEDIDDTLERLLDVIVPMMTAPIRREVSSP